MDAVSIRSMGTACLVDVETTGLSPYIDEVVEVALARFTFCWDTGRIYGTTGEYVGFRAPDRPIPQSASRVHGITDEMVEGATLDSDRICSLLAGSEFIVAHNASFDRLFLEPILPISKRFEWYCSMRHIDWTKRGFCSRGLQQLLLAHHIVPSIAHRAQADVHATLELLSQYDSTGKPYFRELLAFVKSRRNKTRRGRMVK